MKKTQRLIIILGDISQINKVIKPISGFHACKIIQKLAKEIIQNVYHFNKNAVYFTTAFKVEWKKFNPIIIKLDNNLSDISSAILNIENVIRDFPKILDVYEIDAGDHASQDSSKTNTSSTDNCVLCKILRHETEKPEHIVYQTPNFYVVPGTGAFFDGYLMIVPKRHVMSFANLEKNELDEFFGLLDDIRSILESIYKKGIFSFECGSGKTGAGKHETSIVHAHFHLAPTQMPVLKEIQKSGLQPAPISKENLSQFGDDPYMLYVDQEDNYFIASDPNAYYPRQHPRQVLANWMDCYEIYNWRTHPFRDRMETIAEQFRTFCKENYESLPKWVQRYIVFED